MGTVYRLGVWRELRATLEELATVAELAIEAERIRDAELGADCRRWHRVRVDKVRTLGPRLVAA